MFADLRVPSKEKRGTKPYSTMTCPGSDLRAVFNIFVSGLKFTYTYRRSLWFPNLGDETGHGAAVVDLRLASIIAFINDPPLGAVAFNAMSFKTTFRPSYSCAFGQKRHRVPSMT